MAHYYTTRYNPHLWPPSGDDPPPGVEWSEEEWGRRGGCCCGEISLRGVASEIGEARWVYRTRYRAVCLAHGEAECVVESHLDWISPNEYLLIQERV